MGRGQNFLGELRSFLGIFSLATALLGVVALLVALLLFILFPELRNVARTTLGIGVILILLFILGAFNEVKAALMGRQARYGTNTTVMVLSFLGIAILVNIVSAQNHQRFDLTAGGQFTLARHTLTVLSNLKEPVKVTGFFPADAPSRSVQEEAKNLLNEYTYHSDKISYEFIDPDEKPSVARQYEIKDYGALVFESGGKRKQIFSLDEQSFTGAILNVTGAEQLKIYFLTGHGEHNLDSPADDGMSYAREGLEGDNYQVKTLNLATDPKVPDDAAVLVVAAPKKPLLENEIKPIEDYLRKGGKALFLMEPGTPPELKVILAKWGVKVEDGHVIDRSVSANQEGTQPAALQGQYYFPQITKDLATTFYPEAVGLKVDVPEDDQENILVSPLALTTLNSWLEKDPSKIAYDEGVDLKGPWPLALTVEAKAPIGEKPPATTDGAPSKAARLVVFSDSDFATNKYFYYLGNGDAFLNSVNWLTAQEELVSIRPKPSQFRRLVITQRGWDWILYSSIVFLPLAILLGGGVAWWRRR